MPTAVFMCKQPRYYHGYTMATEHHGHTVVNEQWFNHGMPRLLWLNHGTNVILSWILCRKNDKSDYSKVPWFNLGILESGKYHIATSCAVHLQKKTQKSQRLNCITSAQHHNILFNCCIHNLLPIPGKTVPEHDKDFTRQIHYNKIITSQPELNGTIPYMTKCRQHKCNNVF